MTCWMICPFYLEKTWTKIPGRFIQNPTKTLFPFDLERILYQPWGSLGYLPQILCGSFFVREILHIRIAVYYLSSFGVMQKACLMFGRNSQSWMQVCKSMVPWGFPTLYSYILHVRCWTLLHNLASPCCWFFRKEKKTKRCPCLMDTFIFIWALIYNGYDFSHVNVGKSGFPNPPKQKSSKTYPDTVDGKDPAPPGMYKTL